MANTSTNAGRHFAGSRTGGVKLPPKGQKAPAGNSPKTAASAQNRPQANIKTNTNNPSSEAEALINRPPMPFQTKQGPAQMPVGSGAQGNKNVGDGKSKNFNGLKTIAKPGISATGNTSTGGYSKVVGGQKGTSSPKRKSDPNAYAKLPAKRNAVFFGGR